MSHQPKISKGTRVVVIGSNARFERVVESQTTQANTQLVLKNGSRSPKVLAASSLAIAENGTGCSPETRAARAVTNGGPGAAALEYLDEDEEAEDPPPTAEGDDGEDDSSEDEKPAPEGGGGEYQAKRQACLARLGALVGTQVQVYMIFLSPTRSRLDSIHLALLNLFAHLGFVGREHGDLNSLAGRAVGTKNTCCEGLDRIFRHTVDIWTQRKHQGRFITAS
jgi:hypothetical protein